MKKIIVLLLLLFASQYLFSQSGEIPSGSCGLLMTYDGAGNRIKREYYCNNSSSRVAETAIAQQENAATADFEPVDALYPNPTTGRFYISFSKAIDNAIIQIADVNGKIIQKIKASGTRLELDLSNQPGGTYFVMIQAGEITINKKVIKAK
jgi:hypothetical protein